MLAKLVCCIEGGECLKLSLFFREPKQDRNRLYLQAGIVQRDISIGNPMINEDNSNPCWPGFLIDLDLATEDEKEKRA